MPKVLEGQKCPDCGGGLVREELPYPRVRCTQEGHLFEYAATGIGLKQSSREERLARLEESFSGEGEEPFQMSERGRKILKEFLGEAPSGQKPDDPKSILMQMAEHNAIPNPYRPKEGA